MYYRNLAKTISTQTPEMEQKYRKIYKVFIWITCCSYIFIHLLFIA